MEVALHGNTQAQALSYFPPLCDSPQVFVHGDELDNYFKDFDESTLPTDFDGKTSAVDCKAIATKLFGSEDTAL